MLLLIALTAALSFQSLLHLLTASPALQLWDIAGHERFGHMTHVYYKYAIAAIIVFDLGRPATFESVLKVASLGWPIPRRTVVALSSAPTRSGTRT